EIAVTAKLRYTGRNAAAVFTPDGEGAMLWFDEPQRAVTPGQAGVFYEGDRVLGGGYIEGPSAG
ncbi:MAG: aminomethyltransferase beta-barrel domain-containing protein, partial [Dehalococcoidia bacterium]